MSIFTAEWVKPHPAIVHFPIAFLLLASVSGLLFLYWRRTPILLTLTWAPMLLGWMAGIAAILSGLWAQSGLPPDAPYLPILNWHVTTGFAQALVYGALLYQRWRYPMLTKQRAKKIGASDRGQGAPSTSNELLEDARTRWWVTLLLIVGALLILASGWNGGRLVYEWGVNVQVDAQ